MVAPFTGLVELLSGPRLALEAADGRRALAREDRLYDIVQVDAMFRTSAGSNDPIPIDARGLVGYLSSKPFQSGVAGVASGDSAFSTANAAIFSTAHGKCASLRLR